MPVLLVLLFVLWWARRSYSAWTGSFSGAKNLAYDETNDLIYTQDALPGVGALFSFTPPK